MAMRTRNILRNVVKVDNTLRYAHNLNQVEGHTFAQIAADFERDPVIVAHRANVQQGKGDKLLREVKSAIALASEVISG